MNAFLVIRLLSQGTINSFVLIERVEQAGVLLSILLTYLLLKGYGNIFFIISFGRTFKIICKSLLLILRNFIIS